MEVRIGMRRLASGALVLLALSALAARAGSKTRTSGAPSSSGASTADTSSPKGVTVRPCATAQLHLAITHTSAAAGTVGGYLSFTNVGDSPCRLTGWPEVVGVRDGATGAPALRVRSALSGPSLAGQPVVTLAPGEHADAVVAGTDIPGAGPSTCPAPYTSLRVTPPGATASVTVSAWITYANAYLPACTRLVVTMVVPPNDLFQG